MHDIIRFNPFVFNSRLSDANILLKFSLFSILVAWFCSTLELKVPNKDRLFVYRIQEFGVINRKVCDVALI